jgi:serine/threonine protein kinase
VAARRSAQLPGHVLGKRFLIERVLARGRMGTVLLAADQQTEDSVSIRIFDPAYSEETLRRLFNQRSLLLSADHPNLLSVVDLAEQKGVAYLVEQYNPGRTLDKLLEAHSESDGLPFDKKVAMAQAIASGLAYAHERGIVHGNLKDDKIYVDGDRLQIGGMGLGRLDEGILLLEAPRLRQVVAYLAPEQILGQPIDVRTDLYALGVILYQLFTGQCPFQGDEREVLQAHLDQEARPPLHGVDHPIPPALQALILKLLNKDPADRGDGAEEVRQFLWELIATDQPFQTD